MLTANHSKLFDYKYTVSDVKVFTLDKKGNILEEITPSEIRKSRNR